MGLDSYQMNRLKVGGHHDNISPNVNEFMEACYRFDNMWTPFARTYPSWMIMFTGRYPINNGIRFNLVPDSHLNPTNKMLANELQKVGYHTFWGIDETRFCNIGEKHGFDHLLMPEIGVKDVLIGSFFDFSVPNIIRQFNLGNDLFPVMRNNRQVVGYNPKFWAQELIREINSLPEDKPLFINFHVCGNHWPFTSAFPWYYKGETKVESCIKMVDSQMGIILDYLEQSNLIANSTTFLLSDHGDGWTGHSDDNTNYHGDNFSSLSPTK